MSKLKDALIDIDEQVVFDYQEGVFSTMYDGGIFADYYRKKYQEFAENFGPACPGKCETCSICD